MSIIISRAGVSRILLASALLSPTLLPANAFAGGAACVGVVIEAELGAVLDEGWSGRLHDQTFPGLRRR